MAASPQPIYVVAVRDLVEFVLRRGDLGGERDFVGPGRALAGTRGQARVQRGRPAGYRKEVAVRRDLDGGGFVLRVQGRIDGILVTAETTVVEEIKTVQGAWDGVADPLHWAQVRMYAAIYAQDHALNRGAAQLTYLNLDTGAVTDFRESWELPTLARFFAATAGVYLAWVRDRHAWCQQRDRTLGSLRFPHARYRPGQRALAVAAYRTMARGGRLFAEGPTGIGKTMAVLFPALKAMGEGKLERLFYLTARTVGRTVAQHAMVQLRQAAARLRTLTLTAREKLCVQAGQPCDPRTCPLALGYFDRRHAAMRDALARETLDRCALESVAQAHGVCPFELGLDVSTWVDLLIGDYNHLFDPKAHLRRHFAEESRNYGFLVDEAHNLVDRGRDMFSAELTTREILPVQRAIRTALPRCAKALRKLAAALRGLADPAGPASAPADALAADDEPDLFNQAAPPSALAARAPAAPGNVATAVQAAEAPRRRAWPGRILREPPADLVPLLADVLREAEAWLARQGAAEFRSLLLELYYRLHGFLRTAALYDARFATIVEPGRFTRVRLFCLDPSALLRQGLDRGKATVFFSATLTPTDYYRDLLGGEPADPVVRLPSPFPGDNLAVLIHASLATELKARAATLEPVVEAVGALVTQRTGNYLVYLPSYAYLESVHQRFQAAHPELRTLAQRPGLSEPEREAFLAAFAAENPATLVGFAVMGGLFGEGIDLAGDRLIGAVIVGVGLPQLSAERDLIRGYFQADLGRGFDYAYLFPGMNRVMQAVGRVIRSERDRGVALLIDSRFAQARYREVFPPGWRPVGVRNAGEIGAVARRFWAGTNREPHRAEGVERQLDCGSPESRRLRRSTSGV